MMDEDVEGWIAAADALDIDLHDALREIESLRTELKETDKALMACGDSYRAMKIDCDEWKHRTKMLAEWIGYNNKHTYIDHYWETFCYIHKEAENWFKDKL